QGAIEVETGVWYWTYRPEQMNDSESQYAYFCIQDLKELDRKAIVQLIRNYRRNGLFYDYNPSETLQYISRDTIRHTTADDDYDLQELKQKWLLTDWMYENHLFEEMIQEIKDLRLPSIRLTRLFFSLTDEWNRLYG